MKVTIDLADAELYRAVKVEAARSDRSVRDVVEEALREWLERREDEEDRAGAIDALAEYEREGGIAAEEFLQHMAAEVRSRYGSDPT
jgi:Arc/MetJ-type ribon-helix-helix transcriptional regulator